MSLDKLNLDDLGISFMDLDGLKDQDITTVDANEAGLQFGPSKKQAKSFASWEGCDGKFFFPYSNKEKFGKISDFVTAASNALKEKERELDRNEMLKRKEEASGVKTVDKKKEKSKKEEMKGIDERVAEEDDDMGFQTVEDKAARVKRDQTKQKG